MPIAAIKIHLKNNKLMYVSVFLLYLLGFIVGSIYSNIIDQDDFAAALVSTRDFIQNVGVSASTLSFNNLILPDISPSATIFLSGLFLLGMPLILFFIFKAGFSDGFFISFLIKAFALKGFFLAMFFIALNLFLAIPALGIVSVSSIDLNRYIWSSIGRRSSSQRDIKTSLIIYLLIFISASLLIIISTNLKVMLLPNMVNHLFK